MINESSRLLSQEIAVNNAGLVLLNSYFLLLMERLGIISDGTFKTYDDQLDAVDYLQYIVTGITRNEESFLVVNKVLSGLSPVLRMRENIKVTDDQKQLIDGLIQAAIGLWSAIREFYLWIPRKLVS